MQIQWPSKKGNIVWRTEPIVWLACVAWSPFTASCHVCYFKDTQLHLTISCREGRAARSTNRVREREEKRKGERRERADRWVKRGITSETICGTGGPKQVCLSLAGMTQSKQSDGLQWSDSACSMETENQGINITGIQPMPGLHFYKVY